MPTGTKNLTQFLHLKKSFHEAIRDPTHEWELYPICQSLLKLRLENTKVKGMFNYISMFVAGTNVKNDLKLSFNFSFMCYSHH